MLRKIKVYGRLSKFLGWRTFEADVSSAAEAMRFLLANWPEVRKHMSDQYYKVNVGAYNVGSDELQDPAGENDAITIVPVMVGSKGFFKSSIGKVITGVALIGLTVATGGFGGAAIGTAAFGAAAGSSIAVGSIVAGIGVSIALSGVAQALSPVPDYPTPGEGANDFDMDTNSNYAFGGITNVSRSGVPLPLIYGYEVFCGSITVSNGIDTAQVKGTA